MTRTTSASAQADQELAFGSNTDPQRRKAFWVDELGTVRTDRLWYLVDSIKEFRALISKRLELMHENQRSFADRLDALEERTKKKP